MADLSTLINAVLKGNAKPVKTRENVLRTLLGLTDERLREMATDNGDVALRSIAHCTCIAKIRRMAAVNANEDQVVTDFDRFNLALSGGIDANPPRRVVANRRRR
jgi:hypothetical protein